MFYAHWSIQMNQWENSIFNQWKSSLKKCHIEGIEATNSNFDSIVESIKRKPYDILDHRKVLRNSYDVKYHYNLWVIISKFFSWVGSLDSPQNRGHIRESVTSKGRIIFRRRDMTTIWHSDNFVTTFWQTPLRYDYRIFHFWTNKNFLWF